MVEIADLFGSLKLCLLPLERKMRVDPSRFARQADPLLNHHFRRRWCEPSLSSRELEHLSELAGASGNPQRAEALSWAAHAARIGAEVRR